MQLPNTREVLKAKAELGQMMEDKFNEMIAEGKPENEAIAQVLAEFGNLDEVADTLGIKEVINKDPLDKRIVKLEEANEYIYYREGSALRTAIGVMLCILCPIAELILGESMGMVGLGTIGLFIVLAMGIALFIYNGVQSDKWEWMDKTPCAVEFGTIDEVNRKREAYRPMKALYLCVGIVLCILAVAISGVVDDYIPALHIRDLDGMIFLSIVAIGVGLIVYGNLRDSAFTKILSLNDSKTVGGNFVDSQKTVKRLTKTGQTIMSVYWPTVTCIYLIWSFVTMDWHISWIIWPLPRRFLNTFCNFSVKLSNAIL